MSVSDDIRQALYDAIGWQHGLAEAWAHIPDSEERKEALEQIKRYRRILERRYGDGRMPDEKALAGAKGWSCHHCGGLFRGKRELLEHQRLVIEISTRPSP